MTTFLVNSTIIGNRDAVPVVLTDSLLGQGEPVVSYAQIQTNGAADGAGSLYRMVTVPSNSRINALQLQADALGTGAALDIGVYYPSFIPRGAGLDSIVANSVINTQLFCSALGCSAATAATDILNSSTNNTIAKQEQCLWQAAGLSSDPGIDLDIVIRVQTAIAAQGRIGLRVAYAKQ